jgi:uncharacterized protein (TIGR03067 family)
MIAAGQTTVAGVVPSKVAVLTEGLVKTVLLTTLKAWSLPPMALGLLGLVGSGAVVLVGQTTSTQATAAQPPRPEDSRPSALPEKVVERPAGDAAVGYVRVIRNPKTPATHYRALFTKALDVVSRHFEQITSADAFTGRIEARQPVGKRKAILDILPTDGAVFAISVRVLNEAGEDRTGNEELDLERLILRQLDAQIGDLHSVPLATGGSQAQQTAEQPKNRATPNLPTACQREYKLDDDLVKFQGTWSLVLHHWKGHDPERGPMTLTVKGDACTSAWKDGTERHTWRIKLDAAKQPKQIDFLAGGDKVPGIYKVEGATLVICMPDGKDRPSEFAAPATGDDELFVFRRLTPADGATEKPVKVANIFLVGNTKTEDAAILKKIPQRPGDALDYEVLRTAQKNLAALRATIDLIERVDNADYKDLRVTVVEK